MTSAETYSDQHVPEGFVTSELVQHLDGPFHHGDGRIEQGSLTLRWGLQHIYDDGHLRVVVRRGDRDNYDSTRGCYLDIQTMAGRPGQRFDDIGEALSAAWDVVRARADAPVRRTEGVG